MINSDKELSLQNCAWRADMWRLGDFHLNSEGAFFLVFRPSPLPPGSILTTFIAAFALTFYVGWGWVWLTALAGCMSVILLKRISLGRQRRSWRAKIESTPLIDCVGTVDSSWHVAPDRIANIRINLEPKREQTLMIIVERDDGVQLTVVRGNGGRTHELRDRILGCARANGWGTA